MILLGSDHAGVELRRHLGRILREAGYPSQEVGPTAEESVDYPDVAAEVAKLVVARKTFGILICGTGVGVSMVANKVPGIRCALVSDPYTARLSREHNDANILALGGRVVGAGLAEEILWAWLRAWPAQEERHQRRLEKLRLMDQEGRIP